VGREFFSSLGYRYGSLDTFYLGIGQTGERIQKKEGAGTYAGRVVALSDKKQILALTSTYENNPV